MSDSVTDSVTDTDTARKDIIWEERWEKLVEKLTTKIRAGKVHKQCPLVLVLKVRYRQGGKRGICSGGTWALLWLQNSGGWRLTDSALRGDELLRPPLHGSPSLTNAVESMKLNSTVERYCLHGSTKVNEAVGSKMAANELVREGNIRLFTGR
jgi:hypothetical protein